MVEPKLKKKNSFIGRKTWLVGSSMLAIKQNVIKKSTIKIFVICTEFIPFGRADFLDTDL